MKKYYFFTVLSALIFCNTFAQSFDNYWNEVLLNNRKKAIELFQEKPSKENNLEHLLTEQILRAEDGIFNPPKDFIGNLTSFKDYQYYVYALWNKEFLFNDYLKSGFNLSNINAVEQLSSKKVENQTIQEALIYLNSVVARFQNDWDKYYENQQKLTAIREWQFCGVFENLNNSGLDIIYAPEKNAISTEDFNANSNGFVNWYTPTELKKEAYQFFTNHSEYGYGVNYAQTFIKSSNDQRVFLRLGNSGNFKVWLNDIVIYENTKDVITDLDAYNVEINIPKGNNRLLIKNAEGNSASYFIARITDKKGYPIQDLNYSDTYSEYNKSTIKDINPVKITHTVEEFFLNKVKESPDNFFYTYCLIHTYIRNARYEEAKKYLTPILKNYPKSSIIRKLMIINYEFEEDRTSLQELVKNLELDDEEYYLSLLYQFRDRSKLSRMDIESLEKFFNKLSNATDYKIMSHSTNIILAVRKSDKTQIKKELDDLIKIAKKEKWIKILNAYTALYSKVLGDNDKELEVLEYITNNYFDYSSKKKLARIYNKQNKQDKALSILKKMYQPLINDNYLAEDLIRQLHKYEKYKESLPYIEKALKNYPYSYKMYKYKGDALLQLKRKDEALAAYQKSLSHNSNNSSLRKKIQDLLNKKDIIESYTTKDGYQYINTTRGKELNNSYGFNILLDEIVMLLYPESGGKSNSSFIYEITSTTGVERFKEYDLGLSGSYSIIKSEIIKSDGSIIPAEKSGSKFVFNGLEIGDVIYINYETRFRGSGRFYRDFIDYYQFDSYHPCVETKYILLAPKGRKIQYQVMNGDVVYTKETKDDYDIYNWSLKNNTPLSQSEYYMPSDVDVARYLHLSTISSWNDIAFWYSDLVRSQMIFNPQVEKTFNTIFPKGTASLTQEEIAKRIYEYIMKTMNYSHVSFRQSGYIPQKPSKTILTKLGDCKDFSTLFVTLAEKAGLASNLVLILTSDYGQNAMVLPNQNFNHCIVKVMIDGKEQFLELTDKHLPFKSLPISLQNATALEIPFITTGNTKKYDLFKLKNVSRTSSVFTNRIDVNIKENLQSFKIQSSLKGSVSSYYKGLFKEPSYETLKKSVQETFGSTLGTNIKIDTVYQVQSNSKKDDLNFDLLVTSKEKINKIGETKIIQLPKITNAYSSDIINTENRKYPIEYIQYETIDHYITHYNVHIEPNQKFTEIPKNQSYTYKNHSFKIDYTLIKSNHLKVSIESKTDLKNIPIKEYDEFKKYVTAVLEAKDTFIGYK
ncbi:DUF3857 domain-containing protein [Aquimarina sp. 2201CG5-10]|uniref:DUF3857 domain-containing protein n=1 Tax=Aquimarina callyspongiae TaxID=3098150 RepID=UPI002AB578AA|nr:DUF3857 domain-containing protein [Aquimarina sp. 2201CG5-10]MDY8135488.1 DUF3857 domain-containing protein [Aquimarina sp. 2201CG5-10]